MFQWQKSVGSDWLSAHEEILQKRARGKLVTIARSDRKRLLLEVACSSQSLAQILIKEFGGHVEKLSRNWLTRFARVPQSKPLKIGKRLEIFNVGGTLASRLSRHKDRSHIFIPAGAAFGTGEHATTAMCLRFLEQITRGFNRGWSLVDLGTGSGILALAASRFGARRIVAIDVDPVAISTAEANARLNKIDSVDFRMGDVRSWKFSRKSPLRQGYGGQVDIVTANLTGELLIELLPKLKRSRWVILSGILRDQEEELLRALRRNKIAIVEVRHRGKWIAVLSKTI